LTHQLLLTAGYDHSKHSLAVLELLRRKGVSVQKVIIVNTFSKKRLLYYFRQLDFKEFKKKALDRVFSSYVSESMISDEVKQVDRFLEKEKIEVQSVSQFCKKNGIEYIRVNSLSGPEAVSFLEGTDLVIYTGGGILFNSFIKKVKLGVLNCHAAQLPAIRGTNTSEWSVLLGIPLSTTLHYIVRKIDMGPILSVQQKDYSACHTINQIRGQATVFAIQDLVAATQKIISGDYTPQPQEVADGKQYYTMHPILKHLTEQRWQNHDDT